MERPLDRLGGEFLSTDWSLTQFGRHEHKRRKQYREFVRDGARGGHGKS